MNGLTHHSPFLSCHALQGITPNSASRPHSLPISPPCTPNLAPALVLVCAGLHAETMVSEFARELCLRHAIAAHLLDGGGDGGRGQPRDATARLYLSAWLLQPCVRDEWAEMLCAAGRAADDAPTPT
eukprot:6184458-Pleurochrysis_carterae.AAC.2